MAVHMGYATLFYRAGLISHNSSNFTSMSTCSASTWSGAQMVFSQQYFDRLAVDDAQDLYDFVVEWMDAYRPVSSLLEYSMRSDVDRSLQAAFLFEPLGITAAQFFTNMLQEVSTSYGDAGLAKREASAENRIPPFQKTDFYVQTSLPPVSRVTGLFGGGTNVFLGPADSNDEVYKVMLSKQFVVSDEGTDFLIAVEDDSLPLKLYQRKAKHAFSFHEWEQAGFTMYDGPGTTGPVTGTVPWMSPTDWELSKPYQGKPTPIQVAVMSSQSTSDLDSLAPASFAQRMSIDRFVSSESDSGFLGKMTNRILMALFNNILYGLAGKELLTAGLCSQFPEPCGLQDSQLGDGGWSDVFSLGLHLGQYANTPKVKVLMTLNRQNTTNNISFMGYFNTTWNVGVEPGGFVWRPTNLLDAQDALGTNYPHPIRSYQLFEEYLDEEVFSTMLTTTPGVDVSIARMTLTVSRTLRMAVDDDNQYSNPFR